MSRDRAMLGAPIHEREPNDLYATIDGRCVDHLHKVWPLTSVMFVEPMAGFGDLIAQIELYGGILHDASDMHAYPDADPRIRTGVNVFEKPCQLGGVAIITNPPYTILRSVIRHLLTHAPRAWIIILCRASQLHVLDMRPSLEDRRFHGVAPLPFRPLWYVREPGNNAGPRHEYAWFIWSPDGQYRYRKPQVFL
jgi:hypothetical protein